MRKKTDIMDREAVGRTLIRMSHQIIERNHGTEGVCLVGIKRRGISLAEIIADNIKNIVNKEIPTGYLDITLYRDDLTKSNKNPIINDSKINFDISGMKVVLVDDVIYTGRTVRAAIEALLTFGRPDVIQLAVLVDRGHRELPIRPDFVGKNIPTSRDEVVSVFVDEYDGEVGVVLFEKARD
ncbi:MAG: bifunctional pyr operon transcriptional regulator/uracil phosphoribosyltransferase PyrR [Eubacteriales bacterium]